MCCEKRGKIAISCDLIDLSLFSLSFSFHGHSRESILEVQVEGGCTFECSQIAAFDLIES